jgi:DNA-binding transcriptional LysR family regulator
MELHEVRYFLSACETLNFRRAAERCNVTQPALTRAIQKLEKEFCGLLFSRDRQPLLLTELGRLIRPQMQEMLRHAEAAKTVARQLHMMDGAPLRLGVMCTIGPAPFTHFAATFHANNPGIEVSLQDGLPRRLSELLLDGEIDAAVMAQPEAYLEGLHVAPLYRERFSIGFGVDHPFAAKTAVRLADLHMQNHLRRLNCEYREHLCNLLCSRGFSVKVRYQSDREDWIQSLAAAGLGVCFLPEHLGIVPGLRLLPLVEPEVFRCISLVTVAGRRHAPALARFMAEASAYAWPKATSAVTAAPDAREASDMAEVAAC